MVWDMPGILVLSIANQLELQQYIFAALEAFTNDTFNVFGRKFHIILSCEQRKSHVTFVMQIEKKSPYIHILIIILCLKNLKLKENRLR